MGSRSSNPSPPEDMTSAGSASIPSSPRMASSSAVLPLQSPNRRDQVTSAFAGVNPPKFIPRKTYRVCSWTRCRAAAARALGSVEADLILAISARNGESGASLAAEA